jgi:hypothetical protein
MVRSILCFSGRHLDLDQFVAGNVPLMGASTLALCTTGIFYDWREEQEPSKPFSNRSRKKI